MKHPAKIIFSAFLVIAGVVMTFAQKTKEYVDIPKPFDIKGYGDWQKITLGNLSFFAPKELKPEKVNCFDSECYSFVSENMRLDIDRHIQAFKPDFERDYPGYTQKYLLIDNTVAWIWFFEKKNDDYKYISGVNIISKKNK